MGREASIRPRLYYRGNLSAVGGRGLAVQASIRPRLYYRGNQLRQFAMYRTSRLLQFGHGFITVEIRRTVYCVPVPRPTLQFGHGFITVEISVRRWAARAATCFNSATALLPWKSGTPHPRRPGKVRCFNSATALLPWKSPRSWACRPRRSCFNSATALLPWKLRRAPHGGENHPVASIRPRLYYRGNPVMVTKPGGATKRFNSATALLPWKSIDLIGVVELERASIRPRLYYRGNMRGGCGRRNFWRASIRPRLYYRGNVTIP